MAYRITDCDEEPEYRYALTTTAVERTADHLVVIQCNPSQADRTRSDPTVGKVAAWATAAGFAAVTFVNLFARRGPHVSEIRDLSYAELVGPRNDATLARWCVAADVLVLAWGTTLPVAGALYARRLREVEALCEGRPVHRVGALVQGRYPRHGRMWNGGNRTRYPLTWEELRAAERRP